LPTYFDFLKVGQNNRRFKCVLRTCMISRRDWCL